MQRDYVQTIKMSTEALIQLTGDILDFARIESGKLKLDPVACDPREVVEAAFDMLAPKADPKQTADGYVTLAGYFNSLRELGGMRRLVDDDAPRLVRGEQGEHIRDHVPLGNSLPLEVRQHDKAAGALSRPLTPGLRVFYVVDDPELVRYVPSGLLKRAGLSGVKAGAIEATSSINGQHSSVGIRRLSPNLASADGVMRKKA